jgi:Fur family ferric uptake transcriptional regulator
MTTLDEFRTAQDVHAELRERGEAIGLATVYRTLARMAADGEIDSIRTPDGVAAYRRCSAGHHHHLVCRECGRTVEITPPDLEAWAEEVGREFGFTQIDHELELFGRCADCG